MISQGDGFNAVEGRINTEGGKHYNTWRVTKVYYNKSDSTPYNNKQYIYILKAKLLFNSL